MMAGNKEPWYLAERYAVLEKSIKDVWLLKIFDQEFGFSDLLSNYSRTYSWMANQLGHLTLGLGFALILKWIAISVMITATLPASFVICVVLLTSALALMLAGSRFGENTILVLPICGALLAALALKDLADAPDLSGSEVRLYTLLFVWPIDALTVLVAVAGGLATVITIALGIRNTIADTPTLLTKAIGLPWSDTWLPSQEEAIRDLNQPDQKIDALLDHETQIYRRRGSWVPTVISAAVLVLVLTIATWHACTVGTPRHLGIILSMGIAGGAVLAICADGRLAALATMAVISAGLLAVWGDPDFLTGQQWNTLGSHIWWALIVIPALTALTYRRSFLHRTTPKVLCGLSLLASLFLCSILTHAEQRETLIGLAFAVAALATSCAKEFGSDLPRVRADIARARKARDVRDIPQLGGGDSLSELELGYLKNGIQDTRTDAAFYFSGACIAAGLPVDPHLLGTAALLPDADVWTASVEIVGLILFILCFLAFGRNWALRQDAIDKTGAYRANSMALFWGILNHNSTPVCQSDLARFARGEKSDGSDLLAKIRHLVVLGSANSGKSALGAALATEAALSEISSTITERPKESRRRARLINMSTLRWTHDYARARSEQLYNPTRPFYQVFDGNEHGVDGQISPRETKKIVLPPAQFVVLDNCNGTREDVEVVCDRLSLANEFEQSTVWLVCSDTATSSAVNTGPDVYPETNAAVGSFCGGDPPTPINAFARDILDVLVSKDPHARDRTSVLHLGPQ